MALENKMKEKMTQTTSRQKVIIAVMVIVVLIIVWQIVGLMGGGSSAPAPSPTIQPKSTMSASKPGAKEENNHPSVQAAVPAADHTPKMASGPQVDESLRQPSIVNDPQFNRIQRMTEEKYVGKLNELEELRIQRQIAETNQAIAAAKLATVTAEKDISDLLTTPAPSASVYSTGQPVKTSVDVIPPGGAIPNASPSPSEEAPKTAPPPAEVVPYKLVSVSMLLNKWTAIVALQNTMFTVAVGDVLPPDGSVVTSISKSSITLRKNGKSRKISITSSF